jgi:hypothetical protein
MHCPSTMKNLFFIFILFYFFQGQTQTQISGPYPDDSFMAMLNPLGPTYNIYHLDRLKLTKGKTKFEPWASSYWPIHRGILAYRYMDRASYSSKAFIDNHSSFLANPSINYVASGQVDRLSPAEKYDLLVGDSNWSLTRAMWAKGMEDYQTKGIVAGWTGICHGWSAISQMAIDPPKHGIVVRDATNTFSIRFHESDIKGLLSYLWAESPPETRQAGHRCNQVPINRDPFLRPVEVSCLDTNPMTWHLSITNRVGRYQKSFVMDSSLGAEVWNYPISSYDYSYFNPRTFEPVHSLKSALVPIQDLTNDRYATLRNSNTKYIVGIIMDTFHPALIEPTSGTQSNSFQTHTFIYDLELDENYDVIGGEWYSEDQPDFIWTFPEGSKAQAREDLQPLPAWDGISPVPAEIAQSARSASLRGKVMATIVDKLHIKSLE